MGTHRSHTDLPGQEQGAAEASKSVPTWGDRSEELFMGRGLIRCEISDWIYLNEGDRIVVERAGMRPKAGVIDTITEDAYVLWVWLEQGEGRIMISAEENDRVWQLEIR